MLSIKGLIEELNDHFRNNRKSLIIYALVSLLLASIGLIIGKVLYFTNERSAISSILLFVFSVMVAIADYANTIVYQRSYMIYKLHESMIDKFVPIKKSIYHTFKIVFIQILYIILMAAIPFIAFIFIMEIVQINTKYVSTIFAIILLISFLLWGIRLLFIGNILVVKRENYKMKPIIKESKALIHVNMRMIITIVLIQIIALMPSYIFMYYIKSHIALEIMSDLLGGIWGIILDVILMTIYVKSIEATKEDDKKDNQLTPASTL